ncbi:hypothetical protein DRN48_09090 [Thermococci archaeon]|nr:MAG: hypothetical protein DRN48_09090 [Thermococci archaeon]
MARTLIKVGGILSVIEPFFIAVLLLLTVIGILFAIPFAILGYWIYKRTEGCTEFIENGEYKNASFIISFFVINLMQSPDGKS